MQLASLLALPAETAIDLLRSRRLTLAESWVCMQGAAKYIKALATGDIAAPEHANLRAAKCARRCPRAVVVAKRHPDGRPVLARDRQAQVEAVYCGRPGAETADTCGCLVALTSGGVVVPAGKTMVASEQCPASERLWSPCERVGWWRRVVSAFRRGREAA